MPEVVQRSEEGSILRGREDEPDSPVVVDLMRESPQPALQELLDPLLRSPDGVVLAASHLEPDHVCSLTLTHRRRLALVRASARCAPVHPAHVARRVDGRERPGVAG